MMSKTVKALAFTLTLGAGTGAMASPKVSEVYVPINSQGNSRTSIDSVYDAKASAGTLNTNLGIGIILNPVFESVNDQGDFALHQNPLYGTQPYVANSVPNPISSTVTYKLTSETAISGVEIIEHYYGATQVTVGIGPSLNQITSIGSSVAPVGNSFTGCGYSPLIDGESQIFPLNNATAKGRFVVVTITGSVCNYAFALHRMFLLDPAGHRILAE
jgi:hypothetical protein